MREVYPSEAVDAAEKAFSKARREAMLRRAWARARGAPDSTKLASFYEAKSVLGRAERIPLGVRRVYLRDIAGSVSRGGDFDGRFLPLKRELGGRWKEVYRAFQREESLGVGIPPVSLYRIGGAYFVRDGNHRVSVALFRGRETIEAEVFLLRPAPPPRPIKTAEVL